MHSFRLEEVGGARKWSQVGWVGVLCGAVGWAWAMFTSKQTETEMFKRACNGDGDMILGHQASSPEVIFAC